MPRIVLVKTASGKLAGLSGDDDRGWARFHERAAALERGDTLVVSWAVPKTGALHRAYFSLLKRLYAAQHVFSERAIFDAWITVGAGHYDTLPGHDGVLVTIPRPITWEALDEALFRDYYRRALAFLRTPRALLYLWPEAAPGVAEEAIERLITAPEEAATEDES